MPDKDFGGRDSTGSGGECFLFRCSFLPFFLVSGPHVPANGCYTIWIAFLDKDAMMLILRTSPSAVSLHHARGQRTIVRVRVLHIEVDRRSSVRESGLYNSTDIAMTEERKKWDHK